MDNKDNIINDDSQMPANTDSHEELIEPNNTEQPKTSRGIAVFSLLLAFLAVLISSWIFYRMEIQNDKDNTIDQLANKSSQQDIQRLQNRISDLETKITQQSNDATQNQQQINRLQKDLKSQSGIEFDATGLEQQISTLQKQLRALASKPQDQANEPQTDEHLTALVQIQTINALKTVQLLIAQQQIPEAVYVLKQWRNNEHLPLAIQTRLQHLITTLSNVQTPNLDALRKQLSSVKSEITALSLTTEILENEQPAWYQRFITVKKIKPEQQDLNSIDLLQLKANAAHSIQQAELGLTLKQPAVWKSALDQAIKTLTKTTLNTTNITQILQQLSEQNILIQVPKDLGIDDLMQQLEGISE